MRNFSALKEPSELAGAFRRGVFANRRIFVDSGVFAGCRVSYALSARKRYLDFIVASVLLFFVLPLFGIICLLIVLDSGGPVFFSQQRTGLDGKPFSIIKFRTMFHLKAADENIRQAERNDLRVTRVGRVLRRFSLDELPQLLNVCVGDMSLVGPRPHAIEHDKWFASLIGDYDLRFVVRPGITGLAQVRGLRGLADTYDKIALRSALDIRYSKTSSFTLDLYILVLTLKEMLFSRTAF